MRNEGQDLKEKSTYSFHWICVFVLLWQFYFLLKYLLQGEKRVVECFNEKSEVCGFPNYYKIKTFKYVQGTVLSYCEAFWTFL